MTAINDDAQAFMAALLRAIGVEPSPSSTIVLHLDPTAKLATVELTVRVRTHKIVATPRSSAHTAPQVATPKPLLAGAQAMR